MIADVEEEYGIELDPNLYIEYESQPAIIADSLALSPDPARVSANPEVFYNQTLAFEADIVQIEDVAIETTDQV